MQKKLREELLEVETENPTMEELNALPYLDNVIREAMRVHSPVAGLDRVSRKDHLLPLSTPITDRKGQVHESVMYPYLCPYFFNNLAHALQQD